MYIIHILKHKSDDWAECKKLYVKKLIAGKKRENRLEREWKERSDARKKWVKIQIGGKKKDLIG